jgi:DNA-binding NarL/FixJ family response regulator
MKTIFYFEDEPELLRDCMKVLRTKYEVIVSAEESVIKQPRQRPVDLIIVDLMIHRFGFNEEGIEVQNITYPNVEWQRTGVEFLKQVRAGNYEVFGFPATVPFIVATALVDSSTREEVEKFDIKDYFEKPFTIQKLEEAVESALIEQELG